MTHFDLSSAMLTLPKTPSSTLWYFQRRGESTPIRLRDCEPLKCLAGFCVGIGDDGVIRHAHYSRLSLDTNPPAWLPLPD